jgi:hypothetical protein
MTLGIAVSKFRVTEISSPAFTVVLSTDRDALGLPSAKTVTGRVPKMSTSVRSILIIRFMIMSPFIERMWGERRTLPDLMV